MKKKISFKIGLSCALAPIDADCLKSVIVGALESKKLTGVEVEEVAPLGNVFSDLDVDCALCVFDEFVSALMRNSKKPLDVYIKELQADEGIPAVRALAANVARPIEKAWCENNELVDKMDACAFDLEFVPELLARACVLPAWPDLTYSQWNALTVNLANDIIAWQSRPRS